MSRTLLIVVLLHAYIGMRLLPDMALGSAATAAGALLLVVSAYLIPFGFGGRRRRSPIRSAWRMWAGLVAMGAFSSLLVLTLMRDVVLIGVQVIASLFDLAVPLHAIARDSALAVPIATLFMTLIGFINATRVARVRDVEVPITELPESLHGFTIAQISDVHIGPTIGRDYVEAVVEAVNALGPDMVAITGDLVDGTVAQLAEHAGPLARLRSRHGTFFVTGNHEYYSGARAWVGELRRLGMRVLENEHVVLEHGDASIVVAGVTDFSAHHFDPSRRSDPVSALAGAPQEAGAKVLLAHQPRSAIVAEPAGYDLQLSGHTHGGQFFPWNFFVRFQQPFTAGLRRLGRLWVYTSRGTGYWGPPKRFGAPSEITRLRLVVAGDA